MKLCEMVERNSISYEEIKEIQNLNELDFVDEVRSLPLDIKRAGYFNILSEFLVEIRGFSKSKIISDEKISTFADELHNLPHMLRNYPVNFKDEFFWHITDNNVRSILIRWFIKGIVFYRGNDKSFSESV